MICIKLLRNTKIYLYAHTKNPWARSFSISTFQIETAFSFDEKLLTKDIKNFDLTGLQFFIETYGCQMNVSDSEIVRSVLTNAGCISSESLEHADLILINT